MGTAATERETGTEAATRARGAAEGTSAGASKPCAIRVACIHNSAKDRHPAEVFRHATTCSCSYWQQSSPQENSSFQVTNCRYTTTSTIERATPTGAWPVRVPSPNTAPTAEPSGRRRHHPPRPRQHAACSAGLCMGAGAAGQHPAAAPRSRRAPAVERIGRCSGVQPPGISAHRSKHHAAAAAQHPGRCRGERCAAGDTSHGAHGPPGLFQRTAATPFCGSSKQQGSQPIFRDWAAI